MPQLNPEFFVSQLFWLVVTFSFLLVFLWRISLPRIGSVLDKREKKISEDLATAKELQEEAENTETAIETQLKQVRAEVADLLKKTSSSLQNKAQAELEKLDKDLNVKINDSADTIEKNKQKSLDQIQEQIHDITKLTLSKVVQFNISDDDIKKAVKSVERSLN